MKEIGRLIAGLIFWALVLGISWRYLSHDKDAAKATARIVKHFRAEPQVFRARFPLSAPLAPGNPVRVRVKNGFFAAGLVKAVTTSDLAQEAEVAIFPEYTAMMGAHTRFVAARTAGDVGWVVKTLLPEDTQEEIRRIILERWRRDRGQLLEDLRPGITRLMEDTLTMIQEELPNVTRTNKHDFDVIGVVIREKGWEDHIEGIFGEVLWPMIQTRAEPLLDDVGDEIVNAFPVWSMSWAYLAESIPFTDKDRFEKKVQEFIKKKAIPIVAKRESEVKKMAAESLRDTLREERTVKELQQAAEEISGDPRFRAAAESIVRSLFLDNLRFQDLAKSILTRPDLKDPINKFIASFEPAIRKVANRLLMNERRDGINPDLARVLRRKLLREDEDWVLLDLIDGNAGDVPKIIPGLDGGRR